MPRVQAQECSQLPALHPGCLACLLFSTFPPAAGRLLLVCPARWGVAGSRVRVGCVCVRVRVCVPVCGCVFVSVCTHTCIFRPVLRVMLFHILNNAALEMKTGPREKLRTQERGKNCVATPSRYNQISSSNFKYFYHLEKAISPNSSFTLRVWKKNAQVTEEEKDNK